MKIYTSYYAKAKQLEEKGIFPIGISQFPPNWFHNPNFASVAPTPNILFEYKETQDEDKYTERYKKEVLSIWKKPQMLIDSLKFCSEGKDVALCCYETPNDFCHRHILADFLNEKLNLNIKEYEFKEDKITCDELF